MNIILTSKIEKYMIQISIYFLAILWLFPVVIALRNSLLVKGFDNYVYLFTHEIGGVSLVSTFINSSIIAAGDSALILAISTLAAFAFSKIHFRGKEILYSFILMCLAIPGIVVIIPFFYILKQLHLYNTLWAVILAEVVLTLPFAVLMIRNFFDNLPDELMESAHMDGANKYRIFSNIYLPLSLPALVNLGVLSIMWSFQDFLLPTMFLTNKSLTTATLAVNSFKGAFGGFNPEDQGRFYAALVMLGLPAFVIFIFAQKFIRNGVTSGALKE